MEGKTYYITKEKLKELRKEHDRLLVAEHEMLSGEEAPKIFESEDLNPEFVSFHEDMDTMNSRIKELVEILENHELIKRPAKDKQNCIGMGATVAVDIGGKINEFLLVGTLEANPDLGKISNESPVGKALLGHKVGDEVAISPANEIYKIKSIKYEIN
jgi:transcription elongation factor GreA